MVTIIILSTNTHRDSPTVFLGGGGLFCDSMANISEPVAWSSCSTVVSVFLPDLLVR